MASIAETVQAAEQSSRNEAAGVLDLFGDIAPVDTGDENDSDDGLVAARPWSQQQRLREEKETLGLYLSGHPIDEFLPELKQLTRDRLADLKADRSYQLIAGLLVGVRTMRNKRGDMIAFLTLDDRSARLEVSLFAREYEQFRDLLQKDAILVVECQVATDDFSGGLRGRAKEVLSLTQARQRFAKSLDLCVRAEQLTPLFPDQLADCLKPYVCEIDLSDGTDANLAEQQSGTMTSAPNGHGSSGQAQGRNGSNGKNGESLVPDVPQPCPVRVYYQRPDISGWLRLGEGWRVLPDQDLIHSLSQLCGNGSVTITYR